MHIYLDFVQGPSRLPRRSLTFPELVAEIPSLSPFCPLPMTLSVRSQRPFLGGPGHGCEAVGCILFLVMTIVSTLNREPRVASLAGTSNIDFVLFLAISAHQCRVIFHLPESASPVHPADLTI